MADQWYAVYRASDGELVSSGTVVANPLPAGLVKKRIAGPPAERLWDVDTLTLVDAPQVEPEPPTPDTVALVSDLSPERRAALDILLGGV